MKECGKAWKKCYPQGKVGLVNAKYILLHCVIYQVQRMQDMQIESLLVQYRSLPLSRCSLVEEYLQSGRREENMMEEDSLCTDMKTVRGQQLFQVCDTYP